MECVVGKISTGAPETSCCSASTIRLLTLLPHTHTHNSTPLTLFIMSSAHRPTWDPAAGKSDNRHNSRLYSVRQMPSHTKLKFRSPSQQALPDGLSVRDIQSGADVAGRRDLKRELERAERTARNKRRKEQGLEEEPELEEPEEQGDKDQRRLAIQEAAAAQLDKDDDSSDDEGAKGKGKARAADDDDE